MECLILHTRLGLSLKNRYEWQVFLVFHFGISFAFVVLILFLCGGIELNMSQKKESSSYIFSVCHCNLNNTTTHNFVKIDLFQTYNTIHHHGMICLLEFYLDTSASSDNENLNIAAAS